MKKFNLSISVLASSIVILILSSQLLYFAYGAELLINSKNVGRANPKGVANTSSYNLKKEIPQLLAYPCCDAEKQALKEIILNGQFRYDSAYIFDDDGTKQNGCTYVSDDFISGFNFGSKDGMYFGYDSEIEETLEKYAKNWPDVIKEELAQKLGKSIEEIDKMLSVTCTVDLYENDSFNDPQAECVSIKPVEGLAIYCSIEIDCQKSTSTSDKSVDRDGFQIGRSNPLGK